MDELTSHIAAGDERMATARSLMTCYWVWMVTRGNISQLQRQTGELSVHGGDRITEPQLRAL